MRMREVTVSRLSVLARPAGADQLPRGAPRWLVPLWYLLGAMAVTSPLWVHPASRVPTYGVGARPDVVLNLWFMRYIGTAVWHGHLPALVTTALNWPHGINMMWNTSLLLPGIVLAPVTMLSGPATSLLVLLVAGFFLSALSMYLVLRRWGAGISAAFIGGAFYGFSPGMRMAAVDHYHIQFAALAPLIVDALLRLVSGRGRPVRTGVWLGLLAAAQLFTAEEPLVDTALAAALIIIVLAIGNRARIRAAIRPAAVGLGVAATVALLLCGRALWVQFVDPASEHSSPWQVSKFGNSLGGFVSAPVGLLFHGGSAILGPKSAEAMAYLGWPLLIVLAASTIYFWRDGRIRVAGVTFFLLELFSLGGHILSVGPWHLAAAALPWHWLAHLPLLDQALPNRLSIAADGAAGALLAFTIDQARLRLPAGRPRLLVPVAAALVLLPALPQALVPANVAGPPPSWQRVLSQLHLPAGAPVLVLADGVTEMQWQAMANEPISVVGGYCITSAQSGNVIKLPPGQAAACSSEGTLTPQQRTTIYELSRLGRGISETGPRRTVLATAIREWRAAAIITTDGSNGDLTHYLQIFFGPPAARSGQVLGWRPEQRLVPIRATTGRTLSAAAGLLLHPRSKLAETTTRGAS
jgi:hypothetical protein